MIRSVRERKQFLERHGFHVEFLRHTGGGHVQFRVEHNGRSAVLTAPNTPSDRRGHKNMLSCARRLCGVA